MLEKQVNTLLEESAAAKVATPPDYGLAVEKAKAAGKKEAFLNKHREKHNLADAINMDLTYAVCFNLADAYHKHGQLKEALGAYNVLVKNKQYVSFVGWSYVTLRHITVLLFVLFCFQCCSFACSLPLCSFCFLPSFVPTSNVQHQHTHQHNQRRHFVNLSINK